MASVLVIMIVRATTIVIRELGNAVEKDMPTAAAGKTRNAHMVTFAQRANAPFPLKNMNATEI
jgi:hypothetical protein